MRIKDVLYRAPAWALLLVPVLLVLLVFASVVLLFPAPAAGRYLAFAFLLFVLILSRMLRVWEWGFEAFHFLTFCISFVYGLWFGVAVAVSTSAVVLYLLLNSRHHYFTYGASAILIQSLSVLMTALLAGILSYIAHDAVLGALPYFGTGVVFVSVLLDKSLTNRFIGIDWGRLSVSMLVELAVNYNLFASFGFVAAAFLSEL